MRRALFVCAVFLVSLLYCGSTVAQEIYATLTGTVKDPTGAVVPNAAITVHNNDTNTDFRTLHADGAGNYTVTNLPPGNYTVTVKSPGFRTYSAANVVVHVAEKRALDIVLQPGQVTETVNVTETTVPVETSTAAQMSTITGTQVRELELNNRNFEQLVTLQPGVISQLPDVVGFGLNNTTAVSVNGARTTSNNWTVDGADVNDSGSNGTLLNVPSVDAIQEFTLGRSNYDAQYGRSGGGQVLVATKSGTSQFHGSAYEFVRNDIFNANSFFSNLVGAKKPPLRYNDFGFTIGGPLFIPRLYKKSASKTFFFWSEEWRKTGNPSANVATVPTAAQLAGTFSGQLNAASAPAGCITYNAAANTSQISPSCISPRATAFVNGIYSKFPGNTAGGTEYISNTVAKQNYRQDLVRLDQNITDRIHIFGRFMQDVVPTTEPGGLFASSPLPGVFSTATNAPGKNVVANMSWTISPTVVNEVAYNYSWGAINSNLTGLTNSPPLFAAVGGGLPYTDPYGRIPGVSITGFTGISTPSAPYFERNIDKNVYDNFSKVAGNHTIRLGFTVQWMTKTENGPTATNGSFTFRNAFGNPALANFLLGNASLFTQASRDIIPHLDYENIEAYIQDDWKLTPRITLNLGMRYSYFPPPRDENNLISSFDPAAFDRAAVPLINPSTGLFVPGQAVNPTTYANGLIFAIGAACANANNIAPTASCSPFNSKVNPGSNKNFGPRFGFAWDVRGDGKTAVRAGYGIYYDRTLNGIWEQNEFQNPPFVASAQITNPNFDHPGAGVSLGPVNLTSTGTPTFKVPSYQDFNFSIQQQIAQNTVFQIAYVGTLGRHLLGDVDINQVPLAVRAANPTANVNAIRPYPGYSEITTRAPLFNSNYNSMQVSLNRRVTSGFSIGIAYTWSKALSNNPSDRGTGIYDTYDFRADYGPPGINTPQVFIANYVYDLPFFKAQRGVLGHVLGGWELSGITRFQSGSSLTITQSNDPFNASDYAAGTPGVYPGGIGIDPAPSVSPRPDVVPNISVTGAGNRFQWFNTAAFKDAVGHFGNVGRGVLLGPGLDNWDVAAIRNFKVGERVSLQFRGEFFNVFNHTNFTGTSSCSSGVCTSTDNANFGQLLGAHNPRTVQLGAKLYF